MISFSEGDGVFTGYRNRDDLTEKVLITHNGATCYRTGDFGCLNPKTGQLEFFGRRDHQIKLHGQRIELDEIELTILCSNSHITNCLVSKISDNDSTEHLVAYIERNFDNSINEKDIRSVCQQKLSSFMVPSYFILLDKFPLLPSGKIDRHCLTALIPIQDVEEKNLFIVDKLSLREEQLSEIFKDALGLSSPFRLNIDATFTELGANSLNIVKILNLIRQKKLIGSHRFDIHVLLDNPSVRQLANTIDSWFTNDQTYDRGKYFEG